MIYKKRENGAFTIQTDTYSLEFPVDRLFVQVADSLGNRVMDLFVCSSVHSTLGQDDTPEVAEWKVRETEWGIVASLTAKSSVWDKKEYIFECYPSRFRYAIVVSGSGAITDVNYFGGYYSANPRWGSGFFWSGQAFKSVFCPEPNTDEQYYFSPRSGAVIDLMGVPLPGKADWFFTPPPFCFALQTGTSWIGAGVECEPGENRFTEYRYHGQLGFHLSLSYEGHTYVDGEYSLPFIGFDFASDEYEALHKHVQQLNENGQVNLALKKRHEQWWHSPIYCGWGSQCYVASLEKGHAPNYSRQNLYEGFLAKLDANDLQPGIVVLDDKWQRSYGENQVDEEKWPNIREFVEKRHAAGVKVLLWLKAWDFEGLPLDECITNSAGKAIACDPTNPKYEERLRFSVRRMLSADGYDADGFKIDFSARIPSGPGIRLYGHAWGLELMRKYLEILFSEAKRVKPDALIMAHTPHPYLADVLDMIRLNDINTGKDVNEAMIHRAKVAKIACPNAVIDTDNWPITHKKAWRSYTELQPKLGVPSLYYATHIDSTKEELTKEDYALIRQAWAEYASRGGKRE